MDVVQGVTAALKIGGVEVLGSTTPDPPATAFQSALDAVDLGARQHEERIITGNGLELGRTIRNGLPPRRIHTMVITVYSCMN